MMVVSFLLSYSDGSIHDNHVAPGHRVRTQSVIIIMITALKVRFYYVVESNGEEDS